MRKLLQFRLRTLFFLLTLAAVVLAIASRIGYLKQRRDYHRQMALPTVLNLVFDPDDPVDQQRLTEMESLWKERERHEALADAYDRATWRPWMIIHEDEATYSH